MNITTENLIIDLTEIEGFLAAFLKVYRFHNKGKSPAKIIFPYMPSLTWRPDYMKPEKETIPIEVLGEEIQDVVGGQLRTKRVSKVAGTSSTSDGASSKPVK